MKLWLKYKYLILNLSLKKIYSYFFLNNFKKNSYYNYLKDLYFKFLLNKYPQLDKNIFHNKLDKLIAQRDSYADISAPLYEIFEPNYFENLDFYYKFYEKHNFLKFLSYSVNLKLIKKKYSDIYNFAINEIGEKLNILEIGGGVPHGLIFNIWKDNKNFCNKLSYVEADTIYAEFVKWYCKTLDIPLDIKIFPASKVPTIKNLKYNFVFAKDIFEHLDNPERLIDELIIYTNDKKSLLCLDLEPKLKGIQHISPNLPILKKKLLDNNFSVIKKFGDIHIWKKNYIN
jgi:hypothetical protein